MSEKGGFQPEVSQRSRILSLLRERLKLGKARVEKSTATQVDLNPSQKFPFPETETSGAPEAAKPEQTYAIESLSPDELKIFQALQSELTQPNPNGEPERVWFDLKEPNKSLTEAERHILTKVYGPPRLSSLSYHLVDFTKGEACADNERSLPAGFENDHFGVWDRNLVVYALYGERPNIGLGGKVRVVGSGLVVGLNGAVLLPGFFYTPKGDELRSLLIDEINKDTRGDHSINLGPAFENGLRDTTSVELTVYRPIGSRYGEGDVAQYGNVLPNLQEKAGLVRPENYDPAVQYLYVQKLDQLLESHLQRIVDTSNSYLIEQAFANPSKVNQVRLKFDQVTVPLKEVGTGRDVFVSQRQLGDYSLPALKDPSWRYSPETSAYVVKLVLPPATQEKYYFVDPAKVTL